IEPTGTTASRLGAIAAARSPSAVPANTIPKIGNSNAQGCGPSETRNSAKPTANSTVICRTPTVNRDASLPTTMLSIGTGNARTRSNVPQSRSSSKPSATANSMPSSMNVTLNPGTFWSNGLISVGPPSMLISSTPSDAAGITACGRSSCGTCTSTSPTASASSASSAARSGGRIRSSTLTGSSIGAGGSSIARSSSGGGSGNAGGDGRVDLCDHLLDARVDLAGHVRLQTVQLRVDRAGGPLALLPRLAAHRREILAYALHGGIELLELRLHVCALLLELRDDPRALGVGQHVARLRHAQRHVDAVEEPHRIRVQHQAGRPAGR